MNSAQSDCVCNTSGHFEGTRGNCHCMADYELNAAGTACIDLVCNSNEVKNAAHTTCICDTAHHWTGQRGACYCEDGYEPNSAGTECVPEQVTCTGVGQILNQDGTACVCDAANHWVPSGTGCVCDDYNHWEQSGNKCQCKSGFRERNGVCKCRKTTAPSGLGQGQTYTFGKYYQTNSTTKEDLTWKVLAVDLDNCRSLLMTEKVIEKRHYIGEYTSQRPLSWQKSDIRSWLNDYPSSENIEGNNYSGNGFYSAAFSSSEQSHIVQVEVDNSSTAGAGINAGPNTHDKLFILNYDEVTTYIPTMADRKAQSTPYAQTTGEADECPSGCNAYCSQCTNGNKTWWIRTHGKNDDARYMYIQANNGDFYLSGYPVCRGLHGVRPAFWYDYSF